MNILEQKIQEMAPGYVLTDRQKESIKNVDDLERSAETLLPSQIDTTRDHMVKYAKEIMPFLNLTHDDIPTQLLMENVQNFNKGGTLGQWWTSVDKAEGVIPQVWVKIATQKANVNNTPDPIEVLYEEILERKPDAEGLAWWRNKLDEMYANGVDNALSTVIKAFEDSPEKQQLEVSKK